MHHRMLVLSARPLASLISAQNGVICTNWPRYRIFTAVRARVRLSGANAFTWHLLASFCLGAVDSNGGPYHLVTSSTADHLLHFAFRRSRHWRDLCTVFSLQSVPYQHCLLVCCAVSSTAKTRTKSSAAAAGGFKACPASVVCSLDRGRCRRRQRRRRPTLKQ